MAPRYHIILLAQNLERVSHPSSERFSESSKFDRRADPLPFLSFTAFSISSLSLASGARVHRQMNLPLPNRATDLLQ